MVQHTTPQGGPQAPVRPETIPAIRRKPSVDISLLALIQYLSRQEGYCWACNEYLGDKCERTERTIQLALGRLADKRYIQVVPEMRYWDLPRRIYLLTSGAALLKAEGRLTPVNEHPEDYLIRAMFADTSPEASGEVSGEIAPPVAPPQPYRQSFHSPNPPSTQKKHTAPATPPSQPACPVDVCVETTLPDSKPTPRMRSWGQAKSVPPAEMEALVEALESRGVAPRIARRLASQIPPEQINANVALVDAETRRCKKIPNLGAYLRTACEDNYAATAKQSTGEPPKVTPEEAALKAEADAQKTQEEAMKLLRRAEEKSKHDEAKARWEGFQGDERAAMIAKAIGDVDEDLRALLRDPKTRPGFRDAGMIDYLMKEMPR